MTESQLIAWLGSQKMTLDGIIGLSAANFYKEHQKRYNFNYELDDCQRESFNLVHKKDLCYDRHLTPFVYSLWYHGRRVNTFLRFFSNAFVNNTRDQVEIFDLGAGTGAVQFSVGLILEAMRGHNIKPPRVKIINIDSSPFMLDYNQRYLWPTFISKYPGCASIEVEYCVNSWNTHLDNASTNPWITASYLFDISDEQERVSEDFIKAVERYRPAKLLLLSSSQDTKIEIIKRITARIERLQYSSKIVSLDTLPLKGRLTKCSEFRAGLFAHHNAYQIDRPATWDDGSFYGVYLDRKITELDFSTTSSLNRDPLKTINLYNSKLKYRKSIQLSEQQKNAANFFGRQSVIIGPAGSGKSIVISEKIKTLVDDRANYNPDFRVLFTSFNRGLVRKVGDWVEELLDKKKVKRIYYSGFRGEPIDSSKFKFSETTENIILLNFDLLPTRLGGLRAHRLLFEGEHFKIIEALLPKLRADLRIGSNHDTILKHDFIFEEYHKIFYGLNIQNRDEYLNVPRTGMWNRLGKVQRDVLYEAVRRYMVYINDHRIDSIITMRRKYLNRLNENGSLLKFDHVFVDEFQDCTKSDFDIFRMLVKDVNNITFAGDLAQAIQIGKAANIPRDENTSRRENFVLQGSYRVPHRISECISGLSAEIVKRFRGNEAAGIISPVKNSPPGARPIVVYSSALAEMVTKIEAIWNDYRLFNLSQITILEKDRELMSALLDKGIAAETDTILRLKGLEKDCVLWSTRIPVDDEREVFEFAYTILTRTSNVLIIALSDKTHDSFKQVLGLLRQDRLIFYDDVTKAKFSDYCETRETETPLDTFL